MCIETKRWSLGFAENWLITEIVNYAKRVDTLRIGDALAMPGRGDGGDVVLREALVSGLVEVNSQYEKSGL